jgi:hypothetical protein
MPSSRRYIAAVALFVVAASAIVHVGSPAVAARGSDLLRGRGKRPLFLVLLSTMSHFIVGAPGVLVSEGVSVLHIGRDSR